MNTYNNLYFFTFHITFPSDIIYFTPPASFKLRFFYKFESQSGTKGFYFHLIKNNLFSKSTRVVIGEQGKWNDCKNGLAWYKTDDHKCLYVHNNNNLSAPSV